SRIVDSPDEIASHKSGEGHEDNPPNLGREDSMKDPGPRQRMDTGALDDLNGKGEEVGNIGSSNYGLRRQGSRVDAMGRPTHNREDLDKDNVQRIGIDTGDPIEHGDEVGIHGDSYSLHSLRRRVSDSQDDRKHVER
ncbi:hypothetical protein MPER_11936, partial [Moniliophthora perniciosa FA553]